MWAGEQKVRARATRISARATDILTRQTLARGENAGGSERAAGSNGGPVTPCMTSWSSNSIARPSSMWTIQPAEGHYRFLVRYPVSPLSLLRRVANVGGFDPGSGTRACEGVSELSSAIRRRNSRAKGPECCQVAAG